MVDCGPNNSTNRFVCPNDRQLALRAKLKTGWSVKTGSVGFHGSQSSGGGSVDGPTNSGNGHTRTNLDPEEQELIISVIKRAEQLELREQERVGRLVDRLENMRRNALGRSSSQCLLCGDQFGLLGAQSVVCFTCRKLVCQKCAIEACEVRRQSARDQWLCKICAETREMWKKSGAWFFKGLPRYILPGQQNRPTYSKDVNRSKVDDGSSSEDEKRIANMGRNKSRRGSKDDEKAQQIERTPTPLDTYSRQTSSSDSQRSVPSVLQPGDTIDRWEEESAIGVTQTDSHAGSRRGSVASRSVSEWTWSEEPSPNNSLIGSQSTGLNKLQPQEEQNPKPVDPASGTIDLTLSYDPLTDTLHVMVHRAKNLPPMDINGLADPFCKLDIIPEGKISRRLRTKTVHKTRNPEFNENLTFYEITEGDLLKKSLHVLILDDDKYGRDYMGESKLSLAALKVQRSISMTLGLEKQISKDCPTPGDATVSYDGWSRGQILISLCYSTRRRALLVTVVRCANLLPMDNNGFSDPFVKLHLQPDPHHRKHKTSIKWKNLNPFFNEEFPFDTRPNELSTQSLYITVWDKDYGKSNDYLGGLIIGGIGSKGRRLKHWLDMIRYPDHRHEYWHNLTEDSLPD